MHQLTSTELKSIISPPSLFMNVALLLRRSEVGGGSWTRKKVSITFIYSGCLARTCWLSEKHTKMAWRCYRATSRFTGKIHATLRESLISTVLFVCLLFPFTTEAGLYTASDQIVILTPDNVDSVLVNSTAALVVEFYASWCGHCIAFSPVWKSLASDIKGWFAFSSNIIFNVLAYGRLAYFLV